MFRKLSLIITINLFFWPQTTLGLVFLPDAPPEEQYRFSLGRALQNDMELAEKAFVEFLKEHPNHSRSLDAPYWLGRVRFISGSYKSAAETFSKFNEIAPNDARIFDTTKLLAEAEKKWREQERKDAAEKLTSSLTSAVGNAIRVPEKPVVEPLGLSDIDRIRQHVSSCWSPPIVTAGASTLIVDIIVTLDRDGKVLTAEVDNKMRLATDRTFRIVADEAIRTMFNCSPLPVPLDKYEQWKSFIFGFDARFSN